MNQRQLDKNRMYQKLSVFFTKSQNSAIWQTFIRLVNEISKFLDLTEMLTPYMMQQKTDTKGPTSTKDNAFAAMVNLVVNKAQKAYVWAFDTNNEPMKQTFDVEKTHFYECAEEEALIEVKNIRDALNTNIAELEDVNVLPADITAINTAIANYEKNLGTTGEALSHKKGGTEGIEDIMRQIDNSLHLIDKLLPNNYSESHPDMVNEYWSNRAIDKSATHHTTLVVHVVDAKTGKDLEGAMVQINGKSNRTDIYGIAEIIKLKSGTFKLTVDYDETIATLDKVVIKRGKTTEVEIKIG
jgi:hypothetical protein